MAISFVNGVGGKDPSNTTNHTIVVPSGVAIGDLIVFLIAKSNVTGTINTPAGWTATGTQENATVSEGSLFWKVVTASEVAGSTITVTFSSGTSQIAGYALLAFRGVDPVSPVVGVAVGVDGSAVGTHTVDASAVSPTGDAVAAFLSYFTSNSGTFNATPPSGFTEGAESATGSTTVGAEAGYKLVTAGSLGSLSSTTTNVARGLNFVIALKALAVTTVALGQATETSTAQPVTRTKARALGQATETDVAQPVARVKRRTLGQAAEVDTAQPVTRVKLRALGQAVEVGLAQAFAALKARLLGQAEEVDEATALALSMTLVLGQAEETDTAGTVTGSKSLALGQATELDEAGAITGRKVLVLGQAEEFDLAQVIAVIAAAAALSTDGYTDAVVGIVTAPGAAVGIVTAPSGRY